MSSSTQQALRHVVLLKFKADTSTDDIKLLEQEFYALATVKISEVKSVEWGTNVSKENLDHGYTHCFILTFANEHDRDVYIDHQDHTAFVNLLKPHMESATVVDFWVNN
jgi:hypothetical protein